MIIAPSILSADWSNIVQELRECEHAGISHIHLDVMDGNFVPPITFGSKFISDIRAHTKMFFDVHIMVENPEKHIDSMIKAGANALTFHYEATRFSLRLLSYIRNTYSDVKVGIAINPQTSINAVIPVLSEFDILLLMGVEPGFGGQPFIPFTLEKIKQLVELKKLNNYSYTISVDGGVNKNTVPKIIGAGADILIMGSAFFSGNDKKQLVQDIQSLEK